MCFLSKNNNNNSLIWIKIKIELKKCINITIYSDLGVYEMEKQIVPPTLRKKGYNVLALPFCPKQIV